MRSNSMDKYTHGHVQSWTSTSMDKYKHGTITRRKFDIATDL